ncbi:unnamed protein product [Nezara viridula]|uniref:Uncharacterized protein n=1 Tax=Nezara viridula TaxID=85310 RepID=A0A9P0H9S8_NEZVI|nr:unnamed protein product [Nezara viridula]
MTSLFAVDSPGLPQTSGSHGGDTSCNRRRGSGGYLRRQNHLSWAEPSSLGVEFLKQQVSPVSCSYLHGTNVLSPMGPADALVEKLSWFL